MSEKRVQDIATLARCPLIAGLPLDEVGLLLTRLTPVTVAIGHELTAAGGDAALSFVLEGEAELFEGGGVRRLGPPDAFFEAALVGQVTAERVVARKDLRLAQLSRAAYQALATAQPGAALHLVQGALRAVTARSASASTHPTLDSGGSRVADHVPGEMDGALVVAARVGERLLALNARCSEQDAATPITTRDWEGRDVFRRTAGLVLLEAARQLGVSLRLGPSITSGGLVVLESDGERGTLAQELDQRFADLCQRAVPIEEELCSVEEALRRFHDQGDEDACLLLEESLEPVVTLLRCGSTWASVPRPLLPHAGFLGGVHVLTHPLGLLLDFGPRIRTTLPQRGTPTMAMELRAPRYGAPMTLSAASWLQRLGVKSVGTFNRVCVQGKVAELIRVSEGFHEKRIAEIADHIKQRQGVRIVAVAGPSSSGKTTFIKRLLVQLRVNGIQPLELSLDDYYASHEHLAPGENGELDLEQLYALDVAQLRADLGGLLSGAAVRPPRYDFQAGKSRPQAGAEMRLAEDNVLLLEGIHALNPELYGAGFRSKPFGVFIHPATSLPFDRLSSLEPADVRLLRRIVRDRHQRGFAAVETLARWPSVRRGERLHIFPFQGEADEVFDTSLVYEVSVLRVYAERYLLEVPRTSSEAPSARRLRQLLQLFVPIHPDHVPPTSLLREFIGGSGFSY